VSHVPATCLASPTPGVLRVAVCPARRGHFRSNERHKLAAPPLLPSKQRVSFLDLLLIGLPVHATRRAPNGHGGCEREETGQGP
jgi:hypothetical protein